MRHALLATGLALCLAFGACGDSASGGLTGDWVIDADDFVKNALAAGMPAEMAEKAKAEVKVTMTLKGDGTWATTGSMQGDAIDDAGTWKADGDKVTFTWTKRKGKDVATPESVTATLKDGAIHIKPDPKMPMSMRMIRK